MHITDDEYERNAIYLTSRKPLTFSPPNLCGCDTPSVDSKSLLWIKGIPSQNSIGFTDDIGIQLIIDNYFLQNDDSDSQQ
uniref:Uncharacterized protein n=1 Tax=Desulfatirhabdium butyrativorans TaxID=340467 RepID=A0A7C4RR11_9BACT